MRRRHKFASRKRTATKTFLSLLIIKWPSILSNTFSVSLDMSLDMCVRMFTLAINIVHYIDFIESAYITGINPHK